MDAFDADALIYAAVPDHPLGRRVRSLLASATVADAPAGLGSVLLVTEVLVKPIRDGDEAELRDLVDILARLELLPVDQATAELALAFAATYRLKTVDAVHLATAVAAGADRFVTNNQRDFSTAITEIDIVYPADLP